MDKIRGPHFKALNGIPEILLKPLLDPPVKQTFVEELANHVHNVLMNVHKHAIRQILGLLEDLQNAFLEERFRYVGLPGLHSTGFEVEEQHVDNMSINFTGQEDLFVVVFLAALLPDEGLNGHIVLNPIAAAQMQELLNHLIAVPIKKCLLVVLIDGRGQLLELVVELVALHQQLPHDFRLIGPHLHAEHIDDRLQQPIYPDLLAVCFHLAAQPLVRQQRRVSFAQFIGVKVLHLPLVVETLPNRQLILIVLS